MFIDKIRVQNFKSIQDSGYVEIHEKFNVIVGKNNSGKTAFIEAIYRCFTGLLNHPSRVSGHIQSPDSSPVLISIIVKLLEEDMQKFESFFQHTFRTGYAQFVFKCYQGVTLFYEINIASNEIPYVFNNNSPYYHYDFGSNRHYLLINNNQVLFGNSPTHAQFLEDIFNELSQKIVYISGERRVPEQQGYEYVRELDITASKLHVFLLNLLSIDKLTFKRIMDSFISVFPEVVDISPATLPNNVVNVLISFKDLKESIPIQQCGSGYYHVLVLMTLLHSKNNGFLILFDEPNSYLHPSAEKAIYDIIKEHNGHQFIFTSHSPILINYPNDKNIYLVTKYDGKSNYHKMKEVGQALNEIGIQNSDFAFADKIIFVEGETEKKQLPKILKAGGMPQVGLNYSILELQGTGDEFSKEKIMARNAKVYKDLFNCIGSQPVPYIFILDRDERKYEELKNAYGTDRIILLGKREFENYLLDIDAICAFLKDVFNQEVSNDEIAQFVQDCLEKTSEPALFPKGLITGNPLDDIKGSKVLDMAIKQFINSEYTYSKPRNGAVLVEWLLSNKPTTLMEISDLLADFLKKGHFVNVSA